MVTFPLTVSVLVPERVKLTAVPPATKASDEQLLLLLMVITETLLTDKLGKSVLPVPLIAGVVPVNETVLVPPEYVPPLFVQFPLRVKL